MAKLQTISAINRLEGREDNVDENNHINGIWKKYDVSVTGNNVILYNGNKKRSSVQSVIFPTMEPQIYDYGQDIYNADLDIYEQLTWKNIQKWLNNGTITNFLKEGDCIRVLNDTVGPFAYSASDSNAPKYFHFYVIGINTHNGQNAIDLAKNLSHIDFCGGSAVILVSRIGESRTSTSDKYRAQNLRSDDIVPSFLHIRNNNGGIPNKEANYGNFFTDNDLFQPFGEMSNETDNDNNNDSILINPVYQDFLKNFKKMLKMPSEENDTDFLATKQLYLDQRYLPFGRCQIMEQLCIASNFTGQQDSSLGTVFEQFVLMLKDFYSELQEEISTVGDDIDEIQNANFNKYKRLLNKAYELFEDGRKITSTVALHVLRYSVGLEEDYLIDNANAKGDWLFHTSPGALYLLRMSVGLHPLFQILTLEDEGYNAEDNQIKIEILQAAIAASQNNQSLQQYIETEYSMPDEELQSFIETVSPYGGLIQFLDGFEALCEVANKYGGLNTITSERASKHPELKVWGLTEKELFGECVYSNPEYAQGQIFQYPIFRNFYFRQRITQDLYGNSTIGETVKVPNMITITPVENSYTLAVGMDAETLQPACYNVVDVRQEIDNVIRTVPIDMPVCFRMQQVLEEEGE